MKDPVTFDNKALVVGRRVVLHKKESNSYWDVVYINFQAEEILLGMGTSITTLKADEFDRLGFRLEPQIPIKKKRRRKAG